jgi:hypothetical protein
MNKRALDRAVAKALGYTYDGSAWWTHPDGLRTSVDGLPRFSADIAVAFTVLDELRRRGLWWQIDVDDDRFALSIILPARDPQLPDWGQAMNEWTAGGSTLPEVICVAAIDALKGTP